MKRRGVEAQMVLKGDSNPTRMTCRRSRRLPTYADGLTTCCRVGFGQLTNSRGGKGLMADRCAG